MARSGRSGGGTAAGSASSVEEVLDLLRARGGRVTSSRRILLEVLFESTDHLSVEDLAAAVQAQTPDVHVSTIYRNLEDLERLGVVTHSHLGHGAATYQLASLAHAHFVCESCGAQVEAPEVHVPQPGPVGQSRPRLHHRPSPLRHPRSLRQLQLSPVASAGCRHRLRAQSRRSPPITGVSWSTPPQRGAMNTVVSRIARCSHVPSTRWYSSSSNPHIQ